MKSSQTLPLRSLCPSSIWLHITLALASDRAPAGDAHGRPARHWSDRGVGRRRRPAR
jgi:hypothetical protein